MFNGKEISAAFRGREDRDIKSPAAKLPIISCGQRGRGATIEDVEEETCISIFLQCRCGETGHSHPKVVGGDPKQTEDLILYTHVSCIHEPIIELTKEHISITPGTFRKGPITLDGVDANDGIINLARLATAARNSLPI
jgi:4-aminobutyrate aminotransferase-like enzyme